MPDLDVEVRNMSVSEPEAEQKLLKFSRHRQHLVRIAALEKLFDFTSRAVVDRIGEILDDAAENELVVVTALEWVGINEMESFYPTVMKLLDDPDDLVRAYAALALIDIGTEADVTILEDKLAKAPDDEKLSLLFALVNLGDANRYVDAYLEYLKHDYWMIRRSVAANAATLAELISPRLVIDRLEEALSVETQAGTKHEIRNALDTIAEQG